MELDLQRMDPWNADSQTGITYYGYAAPGTAENEWSWVIKRSRVVNGILIYEYPYITGMTKSEMNPSIFMSEVVYLRLALLRWDLRWDYSYSESGPSDKNLINAGIWDDGKIWLDTDIWVDFPA